VEEEVTGRMLILQQELQIQEVVEGVHVQILMLYKQQVEMVVQD
jgi:hypothetical protein